MGSAAINLALVAAGRLDAFWELKLGPWDVAAGCLMVEEAGGRATNPDGGPVDLEPAGRRRVQRQDPRRDAGDSQRGSWSGAERYSVGRRP